MPPRGSSSPCCSLASLSATEVGRQQLTVKTRLDLQLLLGEVEKLRQVAPVGKFSSGLSQLVEETVGAGLERGDPGTGGVLQQAGHQVNGFRTSPGSEYLHNTMISQEISRLLGVFLPLARDGP